jgi:hypothetical protein
LKVCLGGLKLCWGSREGILNISLVLLYL